MKKLLCLLFFSCFLACNSDGNGLYGPPDPFEWDYDLGVFIGDVDMYIDGIYESTYESNTMYIASSWQNTGTLGSPWEFQPFLPDCSSSNFVIFNDFTNSCGTLDGEVFTIFNSDGYYPISDNNTPSSIIFWGETYGEGTFDGDEIQIEFYEISRTLDMEEIVSTVMWTGTLTKVD